MLSNVNLASPLSTGTSCPRDFVEASPPVRLVKNIKTCISLPYLTRPYEKITDVIEPEIARFWPTQLFSFFFFPGYNQAASITSTPRPIQKSEISSSKQADFSAIPEVKLLFQGV